MCGIAGYIAPRGHCQDTTTELLKAALKAQHHRGPDAARSFVCEQVGLAHNRLSILDLSASGNQPMWSRSGNTVIVYNGEVYNYRELASTYGLETRTQTDTEVIVEVFEKIGPAAFVELNGMFAFALYDLAERKVWVVRDRLGIKPLYIQRDGQNLAFSSEIKGLLALFPDKARELCLSAVAEWTYFGNALGPRTMFEGISQLEPGHSLSVDLLTGQTREDVFWSIESAVGSLRCVKSGGQLNKATEKTKTLLEESVRRHLVSDVPVGVFLSGGIDSSSIACIAARHVEGTLRTYSASFDYDMDNSELALAAEVARYCGSDHFELSIDSTMSADVVQKMVCSHDQPFSDAANIPLYLMSDALDPGHKVILQGDAGDEMFGGYQRHSTLLKYGSYRSFFQRVRGLERFLPRTAFFNRIARMLSALGAVDDAKAMALLLTVEREEHEPTRVFGAEFRNRITSSDPFARYREFDNKFSDLPLVEKMLLVDKAVILSDIFFQKVDRSTMAASVEVRVPFADNEILDHVISLTPELLMPRNCQKGLLRQAMADVLPPAVLAGKKRGFGVPFGYWVTGSFSDQFFDVLGVVNRSNEGLFDIRHIESLWRTHKAGRADHGFMFWKLLNLALWIDKYDVTICPGQTTSL